jgi:polysaccharide pyruvyl transferase WcaK-like protein
VYKSDNCGSFLQAFALSESLQQLGHEVVFIKRMDLDRRDSFQNYLKQIGLTFFKGKLNQILLIRQKRRAFHSARRNFRLEWPNNSVDCYILGSDTIWDTSIAYFYRHRDSFWGLSFKGRRVVSYAPSVGFSNSKDYQKCAFIRQALNDMASISVRDVHSCKLLSSFTDKKINVICDPTLLLLKEEYEKMAINLNLGKFIFLYYFGKLGEQSVRELQSFAATEGARIITFGTGNNWSDMQIPYDPFTFLSCYVHATYIVTNTFHGTLFAHLLEKRFVSMGSNKQKVRDFMQHYGMEDKLLKEGQSISDVLRSEFNFLETNRIISAERQKGFEYLRTVVSS